MRLRIVAILGLALTLAASAQAQVSRIIQLLPTTTVTTAVTGVPGEVRLLSRDVQALSCKANFVYGSGGTTAKVWVQTSFDRGVTWVDVMNFAFTTASAAPVSSVRTFTAVAANYTTTDGTMADNTIKDGLIGDRLRAKVTTTGTYAGGTTVTLTCYPNQGGG